METGTDPAVLALISTLFVVMIGNFWHQSRESTKTRELIVSTNTETRTELHREINEVDNHVRSLSTEVAKLGGQFTEFKLAAEYHQRQTEQNYKELRDGLVHNGERLARIEGHLGVAPAPVE